LHHKNPRALLDGVRGHGLRSVRGRQAFLAHVVQKTDDPAFIGVFIPLEASTPSNKFWQTGTVSWMKGGNDKDQQARTKELSRTIVEHLVRLSAENDKAGDARQAKVSELKRKAEVIEEAARKKAKIIEGDEAGGTKEQPPQKQSSSSVKEHRRVHQHFEREKRSLQKQYSDKKLSCQMGTYQDLHG
jgi:hypothetical protein